ncbi:MAG: hypothetical protein ABEJ68_04335 [Halobacteriaceae archaeon]
MTRLGTPRRRFARYAGLVCLLAGLFLVAGGLWNVLGSALAEAGVPAPHVIAGVASALLAPGVLLVAVTRIATPRVTRVGACGAALAVVGVALAVPVRTRPLGVAGYTLGVLVVVSTLVAAERLLDSPSVAWRASETDAEARATPADGGEADDDLQFHLDEE